MQRQHDRVPVWLLVAVGIAITVGLVVTALLRQADRLQSDVFTALSAPAISGMDFIHVLGPPEGAARGFQLGLIVLLFGGVPAAILAAALTGSRARGRTWSRGWANVFLAGFVFQVSSLAFTALLMIFLAWVFVAMPAAGDSQEIAWWGVALLLSLLCSAWGLRCWRVLQLDAEAAHTRVTFAGLR